LKKLIIIIIDIGVVQGVVTGVRGLCGGLGPAMFGFIFYLFNVNLNEGMQIAHTTHNLSDNSSIVIKHLKYNINNDPSSSVVINIKYSNIVLFTQ